MKNIRNYGIATGRLTRDPEVRINSDGSRKIRFTVAVQDSFTAKGGKRGSQFLPMEAFITSDHSGNGPYDYMNEGDLVCCSYTINNNNYTDHNGQKVYALTLLVDDIALLETKASKEARKAAKRDVA